MMSSYRFLIAFFILFSQSTVANEHISKQEFDCVVIPSNVADLGSNVRGVISRIAVDRNDFVKYGDVIALLDDTVEQAAVELADKQASIESEISLCNVNLSYAKREEERAARAYKDKAYSLHDFDKAKVEAQLETLKLLQAQEKKILANNKLEHAKAKLAHKTIKAPFSGVVMDRFKTIGEFIDDDAVIRLAQLDPLHVEVILPVLERGKIKVGMQAKVYSGNKNEKGWTATVAQVDQVMDAASGTFGVRLTLPNPDYVIPAGLRCNLQFDVPIVQVAAKVNSKEEINL